MNVIEYRVESIALGNGAPRMLRLVERLAELGRQGWHVASIDLTPHPSYDEGPLVVLLEREAGPQDPAPTPTSRPGV